MSRLAMILSALGLLMGCGSGHAPEWPESLWPSVEREAGQGSTTAYSAETYETPHLAQAPSAAARQILAACDELDEALAAVAAALTVRHPAPAPLPGTFEVTQLLREQSTAYISPHVWRVAGSGASDSAQVRKRFEMWLASQSFRGRVRCGLAQPADAQPLVVAVVVDAMADLDATPREARPGQWLTIGGPVHAHAHGARLVVVPPNGQPRTYPTTLFGGRYQARFNADRPGLWTAQLLLNLREGPQPALQLDVYAGSSAKSWPHARVEIPGKDVQPARQADVYMERLLQTARQSSGTSILHRDAQLDAVAEAHAEAVSLHGKPVHDAGMGDPYARLAEAGIPHDRAGENVARGRSLLRAHQAIWASPAHRANLLNPDFDAVGIGVKQDHDGTWWVVQLFTSSGKNPRTAM